jgi:hypothetical protein
MSTHIRATPPPAAQVYIAFLLSPSNTASGPINGKSNFNNRIALFLPILTLSFGFKVNVSHHSEPSSISSYG